MFFPRRFSPWRVGGVRVGSYTHEGVRVKAEKLAHVRAARSMVERPFLTCLSSSYDVHPKLVPGIGRHRTTTLLIRRRARLHRSSGMPAKFACSFVYLLPYMHEDASRRRKHSHADEHRDRWWNDHCRLSSGYDVHPRLVLGICY